MSARAFPRFVTVVRDVLTLAWLFPLMEVRRRRRSLHQAVALARRAGARRSSPAFSSREQLRRLVAALDRRLPGGGNCVRRALIEMAMDGQAAQERLFAGFRAGGGAKSGHAWLETEQPAAASYDAIITV